ncbi:DEAD/DEAH box helicase [Labilibaculum euxinus]|uniref:DEAD/DEAH box helicase n=1 Tax=Labilibaculum euxinus TaxID=2686357 RepID=A0A7M4D5Z1_9BACT|nr:DEAD/DEAH box helicase [Labilibaculum euxinus]MUP38070.1 DEAD/DEAH box helicase [Labilibaculum euxinus]MVB07275.1 DEAD/DEAH box helicase [Labilibaculum euxinus]
MNSFENLGLSEAILGAIKELGFVNPTPIQEKAIPVLLEGRSDFVGLAQTGTGKTAAYGLPLLELIEQDVKLPQALILSPTRELGIQIADDLRLFSKNILNLNVVNVYGGASIDDQIRKLRRGAHVIVATPGRLLDMIRRKAVDLSKIEYLILDEADEMLNMGFKEDIDVILSSTSEDKLTWLFSATMPAEVRRISKNYMTDPVEVTVGKANTSNVNIEHQYYLMNNRDRYNVLKRVVDYYPNIFGIIFCRTRKETQEVAELLMKDGYSADALHGDLSQVQRDKVMRSFKNKTLQLLVATDVAARGIDVDDLTHVIHYNLPDELEFYTHRSGRTARAGRSGISISLITPRDERKVRDLSKKLNVEFAQVKVPGGEEVCERQLLHFMNRIKEVDIEENNIETYFEAISSELNELSREDIIKKFVSLEFNRFMDYYKNTPDLNMKSSTQKRAQRASESRDSNEDRMFINIGIKDGIDVPRLLTLIHKQCGVRGKNIGRVDLKGVFSFFDVEKEFTNDIVKGFAGAVVGGRSIRIEVSGDRPTSGGGDSHRKGRPRGERSDRSGSDRGRGGFDRGGNKKESFRDRKRKTSDSPRYSERKKREA